MRIDRNVAGKVFDAALEHASGPDPLPTEWTERFNKLARERTYSAVLATALLARAVEPRADAFVLQAKAAGDGYSARGLFTQVIFERANQSGVPLGTIGREPHNNQPFYGHARIEDIDRRRLRKYSLPLFDELLAALTAANRLSSDQAKPAFAAFLRVRLQEARSRPPTLALPLIDASALIKGIADLVQRGGDSGRRGEAVVAAAMDLIFPNVNLNAKANDPSRHWPGDVVALSEGSSIRTKDPREVLLPTEVKERTATEGEILQFASNLSALNVRRGLYIALGSAQTSLDVERLEIEAWNRYRVLLQVVVGAREFVGWTLALSRAPLPEALTELAVRISERLRQKESAKGVQEWTEFLGSLGSQAGAVLPLLGENRIG